MRDRLIELIKHDNCISPATCSAKCKYVDLDDCHSERLADYLLENGVIVPPCEVGDTVYHICKSTQEIEVGKIESISYWYDSYFLFSLDMGNYSIGLGVDEMFLTREEAEQALKGGAE